MHNAFRSNTDNIAFSYERCGNENRLICARISPGVDAKKLLKEQWKRSFVNGKYGNILQY